MNWERNIGKYKSGKYEAGNANWNIQYIPGNTIRKIQIGKYDSEKIIKKETEHIHRKIQVGKFKTENSHRENIYRIIQLVKYKI